MADAASTGLATRHCVPCEGGVAPLTAADANNLLATLSGWGVSDDDRKISRTLRFRNFHEVMEFVNALAWVAHREDHHPDMEVGYDRVKVAYTTHAIGGLSENDFICAAKIDALLE
jgi:4a-hydroxytetrahydrobiopterin dehydratase